MRALLLMAILLLAPIGALAEETGSSLQAIVEQQKTLRADLERGMPGITPRQARVIRKAQDEFFAVVEGKATLDQLGIEDKVRIENALERINAEIVNTNAAQADKEVCWREQTTGSKTTVTRCGTQSEIDQAREGARGFMERPRICVPPGCGS